MKISSILSPSFKSARKERRPIVQPTDDSDFCHEVVEKGWLTVEQMRRAAQRYRLGRSRSGRTIFWMIDEQQRVHDGRIGDSWVSAMLKQREPELLKDWHTEHCLFGLHLATKTKTGTLTGTLTGARRRQETLRLRRTLTGTGTSTLSSLNTHHSTLNTHHSTLNTHHSTLNNHHSTEDRSVCIVEKESSAVVLSELFPDYVWLATSYPSYFTIDRLEPLKGCHIVAFPHTDPLMNTYVSWLEIAEQARGTYQLDITVSTLLEDNATSEQKMRSIDLAEFVLNA